MSQQISANEIPRSETLPVNTHFFELSRLLRCLAGFQIFERDVELFHLQQAFSAECGVDDRHYQKLQFDKSQIIKN